MNDGGPAFPLVGQSTSGLDPDKNKGMTLRDFLASQAITGVIFSQVSHAKFKKYKVSYSLESAAKMAYEIADNMLLERDALE